MAAIDDLETIDDQLSDWIVHTTPDPGDAGQAQQMRQVINLRNQLHQLVMQLQLQDIQSTGDELGKIVAKQGAQLNGLSARITTTTKDISTAETVISIAAQAVAAAAQVAALIAA